MDVPDPCLCGDPVCPNCFPVYGDPDVDEDAEYERFRQQEIDDG